MSLSRMRIGSRCSDTAADTLPENKGLLWPVAELRTDRHHLSHAVQTELTDTDTLSDIKGRL